MDPNLPLDFLLVHCTAETLSISNQKNGQWAQTIHQETTHIQTYPIKTLIQWFKHIIQHTKNQDINIGTYFTWSNPNGKCITAVTMNKAVKKSVQALKFDKQGLLKQHIASNSLVSGGAMAMHLNNIDHNTIKKWDDGQQTLSLFTFTNRLQHSPMEYPHKCQTQ